MRTRADALLDQFTDSLTALDFALLAIESADQAGLPAGDLSRLAAQLAQQDDWTAAQREEILAAARFVPADPDAYCSRCDEMQS